MVGFRAYVGRVKFTIMKSILPTIILSAVLALSSTAFAVDSYQVTGPIVEIADTKIVVTKGAEKERFEINRAPGTKIKGDLKVGEKVTVFYTMTATSIEAKPAK